MLKSICFLLTLCTLSAIFLTPAYAASRGILVKRISGCDYFMVDTSEVMPFWNGTVVMILTQGMCSSGSGGRSGGFNPLYQSGGPRSVQLALKLQF